MKSQKISNFNISKIFLSVLVLIFVFGAFPTQSNAQIVNCSRKIDDNWRRPIKCYEKLWGEDPNEKKDIADLRSGKKSGIFYFGLAPEQFGGFDKNGQVNKILVGTSLVIDQTMYRAWDMVAGKYIGGDGWVWTNKWYLRFYDDSFIVRVYQKDGVNIINESLTFAPNHSFADTFGGSLTTDDKAFTGFIISTYKEKEVAAIASFLMGDGIIGSGFNNKVFRFMTKAGMPVPFIYKFFGGSAITERDGLFQKGTEDGYVTGPNGISVAQTVKGGFVDKIPVVRWGQQALAWVADQIIDTTGTILVTKQVSVLPINVYSDLKKGEPTYIELWYAGSDRINTLRDAGPAGASNTPSELPDKNQPDDSNVRYFKLGDNIKGNIGDELRDYPYFKVGQATFTTPTSIEEAKISSTQAIEDVSTIKNNVETNESPDFLPSCDILNGWLGGSGTFVGCIAQLTYYLIYKPVAWFAGIMGKLFDFFIGYSLSDEAYRAPFAVRGWQIVRDISNIFFILILVWTGFATALGIGKVSMKHVLPGIILNALLINFSLFATRVVIDLSNIVSRVFYNQVTACQVDPSKPDQCATDEKGNLIKKEGIAGYTPLSEVITSGFNPQRLFSKEVIMQANGSAIRFGDLRQNDTGQYSDKNGGSSQEKMTGAEYAGYFIVVILIAGAILFAIAKMFWKTAFMFLGRVIGLYISMIFAPFAFLGRGNMPIVSGIKELSWDGWIKDLTNYAILAPIFVFFLYIINAFIQSDFMKVFIGDIDTSRSFFENVLHVAIPMLIVYFMISYGVDIAKRHAGKIGNWIQDKVDSTVGGVGGVAMGGVGLATGGAAFLGRNVVGRGLGAIGKIKTGKKYVGADGKEVDETYASRWAANASNSRFSRWTNDMFKRSQSGSWDARNAGVKVGGKEYTFGNILGKGIGLFGVSAQDKVSGKIGIGEDAGKGGVLASNKAAAKRRQEKLESRINYDHLSDDEAKAAWIRYSEKKTTKAAENWEENTHKDAKEAVEAAKSAKKEWDEARASGTTYEQVLAETKFNNAKKAAEEKIIATETERLSKYGKIKDAKSLGLAMRAEYVEDLKKSGSWISSNRTFLATAAGGIATGLLMSLVPFVGPALGAAIGAAVFNRIKDQKGIIAKSYESIIDAATKTGGRGDKLNKAVEKLEELDTKVISLVNKYLKKEYKYSEYDRISEEEFEQALAAHEEHLDEQIRGLGTSMEDLIKKRVLNNQKKKLSKLMEDRDKKRAEVDRLRKEKKDAEDKEKESKK